MLFSMHTCKLWPPQLTGKQGRPLQASDYSLSHHAPQLGDRVRVGAQAGRLVEFAVLHALWGKLLDWRVRLG